MCQAKVKSILEDLAEETNSRPGIGSRSYSNPKKRSTLLGKQAKKQLSLPNGRIGSGDQAEPGTIRRDLAVQTGRDVVHGSDSPKNGKREISLWFKDGVFHGTCYR